MSGPIMHASITRRFNLGNYQSKDITIGISQVPLHATDAMIADMLKTGSRIVDAIDRQIEHQLGPRNPAVFEADDDGKDKVWSEEAVSTVKITEDSEASEVPPVASGKAEAWDPPAPSIPDESQVTVPHVSVFGVEVTIPPAELLMQPIEATAPDGGQGRQLRALNASLTEAGFKEGDRHWASLAIIQAAFGGIARVKVTSLKDLTKGEAHVILDFLMGADAAAISELGRKASALKGQLVIEPDPKYCDQHPFCEHNWQGRGCVEEVALV
jgi:hypothetical protein